MTNRYELYDRAYYQKNKEKMKRQSHLAVLKKRFNMSEEDYNILFIKQNGCCAMCEVHQSKFTRKLGVDHCHKTGKIRGLLCTACNARLGTVEDKEFCLKATVYLQKFKI